MIACEDAGNLELMSLVAKGEISPYYINEDGTYAGDPIKNAAQNSALPRRHPLMNFYNEIKKDY